MFVLTKQERVILSFLIGVWLTGVGIKLLVRSYPRAEYFISGEELKLPINAATAAEMVDSRCVSAKLAERIVAYRSAHGPFASLDELTRVKGIGPYRLRRLKPVFYCDQAS